MEKDLGLREVVMSPEKMVTREESPRAAKNYEAKLVLGFSRSEATMFMAPRRAMQ